MTTPPKCEDLYLKIAELERRESDLMEEIARAGRVSFSFFEERDALQQRLTVAEQRIAMLERELKKLRDVAHGCYQIASSYSGCIDGVEEHGGDDHDDPSCAIFHRLYYAMFDADRALKPAAEGEGS